MTKKKNGSMHWNSNLELRDAILRTGVMLRFLVSWSVHATYPISNCIRHTYLSTPFPSFSRNVDPLCSRYRCMSFLFVGELTSVLAFKVLRATASVGVLTATTSTRRMSTKQEGLTKVRSYASHSDTLVGSNQIQPRNRTLIDWDFVARLHRQKAQSEFYKYVAWRTVKKVAMSRKESYTCNSKHTGAKRGVSC